MMWLAALLMLLFYGLAVCTIGGMLASGISAGFTMTAAVFEIIAGIIIARMIYRPTHNQ